LRERELALKPAISRTDDIESLTKKVTEEEKKEKLTPAILTSLKVQKSVESFRQG